MLNAEYSIQKFSENLSNITSINQFIEVMKAQVFDLEIDLIHRIPSVLTWRPIENSFSGEYNLLIYPKITIDEKVFSPRKMVALRVPERIEDCEEAFLKALKQAISDTHKS